MFEIWSRYFWIICLAMTFANYRITRNRIHAMTDLGPLEKESGEACAKWFAILSSIPWLVMGWGILYGDVPSTFSFLRPADGNPYVVLWVCTVLALSMVYAGWVWFADGARKVRLFQLQSRLARSGSGPMSERAIKIFAALGPFFVLLWIWWMTQLGALPPVPR